MSGVSFEIDWDSLPVRKEVLQVARDCGVEPEELVLYYGGDYQLLFTVSPDRLQTLKSKLKSGISVIGKARRSTRNTLKKKARVVILEDRGFEHFR
jgi:thiamine-monophosphate kinase